MTDYTPTTEQVRDAASEDGATAIELDAFDRWLKAEREDAAWVALDQAYWNIHATRMNPDAVNTYYNGVQTAKGVLRSMLNGEAN